MKIISYILRMSVVALLFQCSSDRKIVPVKKLSAFPGTRFMATLENTLPAGKNAIYAASLPFAWDEVKKLLQHPIEPGKNASENFKLLNNTNSFKGCLGKDEYTSSAEITTDGIIAKASFRKDLPFRQKFDRLKKPLAFGKQK